MTHEEVNNHMVEIVKKMSKMGNSFGFIVPKAFLDHNVVRKDKYYHIIIRETDVPVVEDTEAIKNKVNGSGKANGANVHSGYALVMWKGGRKGYDFGTSRERLGGRKVERWQQHGTTFR